MRIVILGHTGFVGKALGDHYRRNGDEVLGYSSATIDLRDADDVARLDTDVDAETTVVLASAITRDRGDSVTTLTDNITMAANVAALLGRRRPKLCVYLSSDAVYATEANPVREDSPLGPAGFYPLAKFTGERLLDRTAQLSGFPLLILRATAIYGPGDTHGSYGPNQFLRSIRDERLVRLFGEGEERRDHLFIDDAVRLIARLIDAGATGVYNLASGESPSFAEVLDVIRANLCVDFNMTKLPRRVPVTHRHFDVTRLFLAAPDVALTGLAEGLRRSWDACAK